MQAIIIIIIIIIATTAHLQNPKGRKTNFTYRNEASAHVNIGHTERTFINGLQKILQYKNVTKQKKLDDHLTLSLINYLSGHLKPQLQRSLFQRVQQVT